MIENILEEYKKITEYIIQNSNYDDNELNQLMNKREELINDLFKDKNTSVEKIKNMYISKGLLELDKRLKYYIENEQIKVKEEISNIHKLKNANNAYEKNRKINNFFNIKI